MFKLFVYMISLMLSIFAVSGLKKGHINESKCFILIISLALTYLLANFIIDISSINLMPLS